MNHFKTILTAGVLALVAGVANAATYTSDLTCLNSDVTSGGSNADNCYGVVLPDPVNDSASLLNAPNNFVGDGTAEGNDDGLWGGGWDYLARVNDFGTSDGLTVNSDGTFSWAGAIYDEMLVILKQADSFAAYYFDGGISGDGTWNTASFPQGAGGLSHMTIYGRGEMNEVPLPAAGFLLLGGLGGLALVRRRKA